MFGLERFKEKCKSDYKKEIENKEKWQRVFDEQQNYGYNYVFINNIFSKRCPNCNSKLKGKIIHFDEKCLYELLTCKKCIYQYASKIMK